MAERLYLDYAATTPVDPRVAARMAHYLLADGVFGNPASDHVYGYAAAEAVEQGRVEVAALLGAEPAEVIFTSGATEANNLALLGTARFHAGRGRHIVSVRSEHKSVLEPCAQLALEGFELTLLDVGSDGCLDPERLTAALRADTVLVSTMYVNNETGVVQDLAAIGERVKRAGALWHVDAVQAAGRLPIDVTALGVDLLSLSAHKLYGPKGIGALYVRRRPRVRLTPVLWGGGQEGGLRPGTLAVHQIIGLAEACRLAASEGAAEAVRVNGLRQRLWQGLQALGGVVLNGRSDGAPHILNVGFIGVHGEALALELQGLAVSAGSACSSAQRSSSHVLRAMGRPDALAAASLRFSLGRFSTEQDVERAVERLRDALARLRDLSPVWRDIRSGTDWREIYRGSAT